MTPVMLVTLITWLGIFGYLIVIDLSVKRMERDARENDDL
jgi:CcmD family protein